MNGILRGLRVIEGSAFIAAPSAGMTLAQMGAEVIRFDPLGGGLDYRRWPVTGTGESLYWAGLNKGKKSFAVDIRNPRGRELLTQLICAPMDKSENNGFFLTNFPTSGWMSYDNLKAQRDDLIMLNIKGNRDGSSEVDYTVNPATGFPNLTGPAGAEAPVNHVMPAWDIATGLAAVNGILAADRHRRLTGEGQFISLALTDVAFATMGTLGFIGETQINGDERPATGNELYGAFGRDFVTRDGRRVMIVAITGRQWPALVQTAGIADGVAEIEARCGLNLRQEGDRFLATAEIVALLEPWCAGQDFGDLTKVLTAGGVSWGPYQSVAQALEEDWRCSTQNPVFEEVEQPGIGSYLTPGSPLDFGAAPREAVQPAPALGEHTDQILADILSLSEGEIGELHDEGIVGGGAG
ncbi:MAG: CoA transferase [Alphaproteobacteria bacterium]|mgnify:FL=1|jgi:2-methylfumaryl-CoA isomerase|nr:2-methylfumaryl-CoA isomerase [Rhodospirillaceae bacterium]MDP6021543.1 CoA transferase [Alphaproteobacteria bacterium]MDP6256507.1 CoA transferase [Alphaproteobacteria bacterium]MDP7056354.1 CoA transferase [Alphaproteobacteria bacterium]MDP7228390.1 CoA transferase [Alphaproteobacteria bacterium]|tara:strand:+ start:2898 stop:4127 length:1230 start_codon:yes stop_codon:yes gene_type:complete